MGTRLLQNWAHPDASADWYIGVSMSDSSTRIATRNLHSYSNTPLLWAIASIASMSKIARATGIDNFGKTI